MDSLSLNDIGRIIFWEFETGNKFSRCFKCKVLYADYERDDGKKMCDLCAREDYKNS